MQVDFCNTAFDPKNRGVVQFEFIFLKSARFCQNTSSHGPSRRRRPKNAGTTKANANNEFPFNRDLKNKVTMNLANSLCYP
jgi:hypothetical protein